MESELELLHVEAKESGEELFAALQRIECGCGQGSSTLEHCLCHTDQFFKLSDLLVTLKWREQCFFYCVSMHKSI